MADIFSDNSYFPWFPDFYLTKGGGMFGNRKQEEFLYFRASLGSPIRFYSDQKG